MKLKNQQYSDIANIIFDLGNVLVDIDVSLTIEAFKKLELSNFNAEEIHPHNTGIFLDLEIGKISNAEFVGAIKAMKPNSEIDASDIYAAWNKLILPFDYKRFELLEKLRANYRIFLLSNTNLPHREYFVKKFENENPSRKPFESYFEKCFYSDEMHLRKPDVDIYKRVLREAGIEAEHAIFIDDNACNLSNAEQVGIKTYHLQNPQTVFDLFSEE